MPPPPEDIVVARERRLVFEVVIKDQQGGAWETHSLHQGDLVEAFSFAVAVHDPFEVGIFMNTSAGGFKYWSSLKPLLFNSTVVQDSDEWGL